MKDGGTIVLCGDYSGSMAYIEKNVTIRSAGENTVKAGAVSSFERPDDRRRRERDPGSY